MTSTARRLISLLALAAVLALVALPSVAAAGPAGVAPPAGARVGPDVEVPQKARDVLAAIEARRGEPPPGHVGGRAFGNRERRLPRGTYREYDVNPRTPGRSRGTERIVIERRTGKAYYTADHYETFVPMN